LKRIDAFVERAENDVGSPGKFGPEANAYGHVKAFLEVLVYSATAQFAAMFKPCQVNPRDFAIPPVKPHIVVFSKSDRNFKR
jgi:hypothetical protein